MVKIRLACAREKKVLPAVFKDELTEDDWHTIKLYHQMLETIKLAMHLLQGHAGGRYGAIWQVLPVYETLLTHFEDLRRQYPIPEALQQSQTKRSKAITEELQRTLTFNTDGGSEVGDSQLSQAELSQIADQVVAVPDEQASFEHHLSTNVNLGWQKLNKYYQLLDDSPVYVAAIVLHPALKWRYIEGNWKKKTAWISKAKKQFTGYLVEYEEAPSPKPATPSPQSQPRQQPSSLSSRFFGEQFGEVSDGDDELTPGIADQMREYLRDRSHHTFTWPDLIPNEPESDGNVTYSCRRGFTMDDSPLQFWLDNRQRWPQLSVMALNVYSTPTMSDARQDCSRDGSGGLCHGDVGAG